MPSNKTSAAKAPAHVFAKTRKSFKTASGKLIGYQFSYNNEGKRFFQTSAFGEEDGHFLSFVLTGKSKAAHDSGLNSFKQLISVYR